MYKRQTVNFNNVLKRGNLQVIKSSEDNLVEGVKFHLYGTSLAGIAVDEDVYKRQAKTSYTLITEEVEVLI